MNRTIAFTLFIAVCTCQLSLSQTEGTGGNTFIGINPAHTVILKTVSTAISPTVSYVPIHITVNHSFTEHFGLSGLFLYRLDKDGAYFLTHEFGFAIGPAYYSKGLNGFFADIKIGLGLAFGTDYNDSDYNRTDLILEPDIGYLFRIKGKFAMSVGIGLQSLFKLSESYYGDIWEWNSTGRLSHYYLPVVNISFGIIP